VEADIGSTNGPYKLADAAAEKWGKIDILVNKVSLAINLPLEEQTLEDWDRLVNLNGRGTFLLTKATLKHLSNGQHQSEHISRLTSLDVPLLTVSCYDLLDNSRIVNIVSISSRGPPPFQTLYAGTKGMQDSFTRCWAKELPRKYGCTVNAVSPGPTKTEGFLDAGPEMMKVLQPIIDQTPVAARMGEPAEIAFAVAMLCEPRASWMNGVHICVDGGLFID
jgi:NAD(P)-dependent dehydrogenase (short-subunit alcohol dehydrogenase family)